MRKSLVVKLVLFNRLLINDAKTEFVIIGSRQQVSKIHIQLRNLWSNPRNRCAIWEHGLILIWQWILTLEKCLVTHSAAFATSGRLGNFFRKEQRRFWCILSLPRILIAVPHCFMVFHSTNMSVYKGFWLLSAAAHVFAWSLNSTISLPVQFVPRWCLRSQSLLVYKALHVKAPSYISGLLRAKPAGRYSQGSDSPDLLAVPRTMFKTLDDRAFAKAGPSLWNELPVDTRRAASVETFKSQLKTLLFREAFGSWRF